MEFSQVFRASVGCVPSPEGHLVASVVGSRLTLRSAMTQELKRSIQLKDDIGSKVQFIRWSPRATNKEVTGLNGLSAKRRSGIDKTEEEGGATARILIATAEAAWIYDVEDEKWHATISQGIKGIKNVEFGRNADEVLIFSEFQLKMTVWSLRTAKQIDIPHPKFTSKGFGYRPCTSHFALLTRPATHDVVSVHCHTTYRTVAKFTLPTMDAQGLKWSPCGRWLAVWDSAAAGYKVLIYTADGHLFRTREKPCEGLGIKTVEWSPASEFLVVGSYDGKISFLSTYTFSPVIEMNHTMTVNIQAIPVWSETVLANKERHYSPLPQPVVLPTISSTPADAYTRLGVSVVAFNVDSTLVATRSDNMPTAIWIWSLKLLRPFAILVHLAPVKSIAWHPTIPDLLMLTCATDPNSKDQQPAVYIWCASWKQPRAILLPIERVGQNSWCKWINNPHVSTTHSSNGSASGDLVRGNSPDKHVEIQQPALVFGSKDGFVVGYVEEEEFSPEDMKKETNEDDSFLYSADKYNWSPREWAYYSPSRASLQANSLNHASSPSPTRRNVVSQKKEGDEAAVDYRASRRITMKS